VLTLPRFGLTRADDLAEALEAVARGAVPLAGGTDLVPNMKRGLFEPARLVSLRRIGTLSGVRSGEGGSLVIGATTTLASLAEDPLIARDWPALAVAAGAVASPQIRNVATVGGNLCLDTRCAYYDQSGFWRQALGGCNKTGASVCHVVPGGRRCVAALSADLPPVLVAYGARVRLASKHGERTLPLADFYVPDGARNTVRENDELVLDVHLPASNPRTRSTYVKLRPRAAIDYPALSIAIAVEREGDGTTRAIRLVVGALASTPKLVDGLDAIVAGRPLDARVIEDVAERARACCHPLPNVDVDADWRRSVLPVYVRRAIQSLALTAPR
jgi:4-hydroxybenzoyl-CoA reductase subunit beta